MRLEHLSLPNQTRLPNVGDGPATIVARVDARAWIDLAGTARQAGAWLISLWGRQESTDTFVISAAYALEDGLLWLQLPTGEHDGYPDLSALFPCTARMQRALCDLLGLRASGAADTRPWLNHGHWPAGDYPLRREPVAATPGSPPPEDYPFIPVLGDGVHEIAVGPIHAGTIEPGHFRFSVVGEKVLRLEQRLGYAHRGIERQFLDTPLLHGHRLAGRIAGDSTVAFAWAFCMAAEQALGIGAPPRANHLRALLLERERVANHLGDLGALGNDAGFAYGLTQFSRLKEDWLRLNAQAFGHRYLMDRIVPGGVAQDAAPSTTAAIAAQCDHIEPQVRVMQRIYDEQSGLQDRLSGTGRLTSEVAGHFSVYGLVGRASGRAMDVRVDYPHAPYRQMRVQAAGDARGDVAARLAVRFNEIYESLRLIRALANSLPAGDIQLPVTHQGAVSCGTGWIEGWRGGVLVALETDAAGRIAGCHCHDPSWQSWPALEHAIIGNIVADFPLINKSFNLNYAGHDL
ncbi:NADH-quinone oxidoreductase subunit C [Pandoraea sp.]|uniref:hydrogenase large subunit n=1 Tax=Pandoraea sp. TaxID=1883445 RepID=UPI0011FA7431|nr:NADH-quinone oxidoreductase subunit C [Pandoraea sp.]TAL52057.1 MAG: Ni,Fe-hydrogenase III large subunit [Pandoraea sp.]TAM17928.1 MAG: Ni,Fe-hydrogenase III large subunit [Pandoraea sp.]